MVENIFYAKRQIEIGHLRAKIVGDAGAPQHIARNATVAAVSALFHGVGVVSKLTGLEIAIEVERPVTRFVIYPERTFMSG